jgi:neutral trehalase
MTSPVYQSKITQPPVLAWAALHLYEFGHDKQFLIDAYDRLAKYVEWDLKNRDINGNGLPEWVVTDDPFCRCDESGMDNTPRFDDVDEMDCIDFAAFLANDMRCLSKIAKIIGKDAESALWEERFNTIKEKINTILWDEEDGFYYDRKLCDGKFHKIKSVASFIPLFAGVCDKEQAAKLVEHLNNPNEFNTAFPIPTISADDKTYHTRDMFRGTVWLNFNYLVELGLREYGFDKEAAELRKKTVDTLKHWYINDGVVYEFYDSMNEFSPSRLSRKGTPLQPYMPEVRLQSVRDFSWGACAVINFLQNK